MNIYQQLTQQAQDVLKTSVSASLAGHTEYISSTINQPETSVFSNYKDNMEISVFYNPDFNKRFSGYTNPVLSIVKADGYGTYVAEIVEGNSISNLSLGGHPINVVFNEVKK